ncbi:MAG: hypothetical protein HQ581_22235 [Planctomycetes bacterium]|nr:hypothetical protein [Planctomycetota bacterium]
MALLTLLAVCLMPSLYAQGEDNRWDLGTDDTQITIGVSKDHPVLSRLTDSVTGHNWAGKGMVAPLMETVWVEGREIPISWTFQHGVMDRNSGKLTLTFTSADPELTLQSIWA